MRPARPIAAGAVTVAPAVAIAALGAQARVDSVATVELVDVLGRPTYRVAYHTTAADAGGAQPARRRALVDATTGTVRPPLARDEAVAAARAAYTGTAPVSSVAYLTADSVGGHHEFRGQPLPAWAVRFGDAEGATAYVPAETGQVARIRNDRWRTFDLLWMLHTMDYRGRDDFNNLALRALSLLGLATVGSGFALFGLTSPALRRRTGRGRVAAVPASAGTHARAHGGESVSPVR
jgi:hypothetical protein